VEMLVSRCGDVQETEDSPTNQARLYCPIATHGPCPTYSDDWSLGPSLPQRNSVPTNGVILATHRYLNTRSCLCHYCIVDDSRSFPRPTSFPIWLSRSLSSFPVANRISPSFYFYLIVFVRLVVHVQGSSSIYSRRDFAVTPQN